MGIDFSKIQRKQKEEEQKAASRSSGRLTFWKPKTGRNVIRLMPPWTDTGTFANQFDYDVFLHWGVGEKERNLVCPKSTAHLVNSGPCPVCEYIEQLRSTGDPVDDETAKSIRAKQRYYSNIIDLEDPVYTEDDLEDYLNGSDSSDVPFTVGDSKIQVFGYGPKIYRDFVNAFAELMMDITDLVDGRDIIIRKTGKGMMNTEYKVIVTQKANPITIQGPDLSTKLIHFDKIIVAESYEEINAALNDVASVAPPPPLDDVPQRDMRAIQTKSLALPHQKKETSQTTNDEKPGCFGDLSVWSEDDVECVGGEITEGDQRYTYQKCPYFRECGISCGKIKEEQKPRNRRAPIQKDASEIDALESKMHSALGMDKIPF